MAESDLLEQTTPAPTKEPEVAHYARSEDIMRASVTGEPIQALCGALFVPTRDPSRFPVCEPCQRVMAQIKRGRSGAN
jgi:hypothetical protein